jgi:glyoxylase-like metal-dependent hydrolase (beta-lactamase superfamily II)
VTTADLDFTPGRAGAGDLSVRWHPGAPSARHDDAPEIQVHAYDEHTVLLRQNRSVNYEAPFLFLLFGTERAVLLDTGATAQHEWFPLRRTVDELVEAWLVRHPRPGYGLVVTHTHSHGDHVAGDAQFADRPQTTVVPADVDAVYAYYGLAAGTPDATAVLDLGGRVLDVIPGPGHDEAAVVFYDRYTGLLFTGDTVYPGRLYVRDWPAFSATVDRLLAWCATHPVTHLLGCHIEMTTTPGVDYAIRTTYQPDEPPLQMTVAQLRGIREAIDEVADRPGVHRFADVILYHGIPDGHFG